MPGFHRHGLQEHRVGCVLLGLVGAAQDHGAAALGRGAEHVLAQRVADHLRLRHVVVAEGVAPPRIGVLCAVLEVLDGDADERVLADVVLMHVALDLHAEELRRQRHADVAVPLAEPAGLRVDGEGAPGVLVEADRHADVEHAGLNGHVSRLQGAAAGGAAVGDVDELQAGQPQLGDHGVGVAGRR